MKNHINFVRKMLTLILMCTQISFACLQASGVKQLIPEKNFYALDSANNESKYLLANIAVNSKYIDQAALYYKEVYNNFPKDQELMKQTFIYGLAAAKDLTINEITNKLFFLNENNLLKIRLSKVEKNLLLHSYISTLVNQGKYQQVIEILKKQDNKDNKKEIDILNNLTLAVVMIMNSQLGEANKIFTKLEEKYNNVNVAILRLVLFENNEYESDIDELIKKYINGESTGFFSFFSLAEYLERHKPKLALDLYKKMIRQLPATYYKVNLAMRRIKKGKKPKKLNNKPRLILAMLMTRYANHLVLQESLRSVFGFKNESYQYIAGLVNIALSYKKDFGHANWVSGMVWESFKNNEKAIEAYQGVTTKSPYYEAAIIRILQICSYTEQYNRGVEISKEVISKSKIKLPKLLNQTGHLYHKLYDYSNAIKYFSQAIKIYEKSNYDFSWSFYIDRANSYLENNQWDKAQKDMQKAFAIAPNEPVVLNFLGYSWADRNINVDLAFTYLQKAAKLAPYSGAIADSLGWAYYKKNQYTKATNYIEKAVQMEPSDPTMTRHLGDVYWQKGRRIEARIEWQRAIILESNKKTLLILKERLDNGIKIEVEKVNIVMPS